MPTFEPTHAGALNRRQLLSATATGGLALLLGALCRLPASATPDDAKKLLATDFSGAPQPGKITITAPEIAENGNVVPITLDVDSPMTEQSYVKTIVMVADSNPLPGVARFDLSPANGQAHVEFRIRLATTQAITAVAQMSDGSLWSASRTVKVTIGGCGG